MRGLFVVAALCALSACRDVLGIDHREITARACGVADGTTSCARCLEARCCAEGAACAADTSCSAAASCEATCTDPPCRARCDGEHSYGAARASWVSCRASQCAAECTTSCGDTVAGTVDCRTCLAKSCCALTSICQRTASCGEVRGCYERCAGDDACRGRCLDGDPVGASAFHAVESCVRAACATTCASWSCARVTPPTSADGQFLVSFEVHDGITRAPIVGARARGCSDLSPDCDPPPFGEATTDGTGAASFRVTPSVARNYPGYIELVGAEHKALLFFQPPLVGNDGRRNFDLPSSAAVISVGLAAKVPLDPSRGLVILRLRDCDNGPGSGAAVALEPTDPAAATFYFEGSGPSTTALATDGSGIAGFANVAPGTIKAIARAGGKDVASTRLYVRAGYVTFTDLRGGYY